MASKIVTVAPSTLKANLVEKILVGSLRFFEDSSCSRFQILFASGLKLQYTSSFTPKSDKYGDKNNFQKLKILFLITLVYYAKIPRTDAAIPIANSKINSLYVFQFLFLIK